MCVPPIRLVCPGTPGFHPRIVHAIISVHSHPGWFALGLPSGGVTPRMVHTIISVHLHPSIVYYYCTQNSSSDSRSGEQRQALLLFYILKCTPFVIYYIH